MLKHIQPLGLLYVANFLVQMWGWLSPQQKRGGGGGIAKRTPSMLLLVVFGGGHEIKLLLFSSPCSVFWAVQ